MNKVVLIGRLTKDPDLRYTSSNVHMFRESEVNLFEPLHQLTPKIELSTEELVEELKRR